MNKVLITKSIGHRQHGFTLIEILIAVAVIGILAAVAVPSYLNYIARTQLDNCYKSVVPIQATIDSILLTNGGNATLITAADLQASDECTGGITTDNEETDGRLDLNAVTSISGNDVTLTFSRAVTGRWTCNASNLGSLQAPEGC